MLKSHDLSVLGYANGFTLWHSITSDSPSELNAAGYFDEAAEMFRPGDLILVNIQQPENCVSTHLFNIKQIDQGNVSLGKVAGNIENTVSKFGDVSMHQ